MSSSARKKPSKEDGFPFVNVILQNPMTLAQSIADGKVPVGAMSVNIAFLKNWARKFYTKETYEHGLKITIQSLGGKEETEDDQRRKGAKTN